MSNKERSDDVVIRSRPPPIKKLKPLSQRDKRHNMMQLSDDPPVKSKTTAHAHATPAPAPTPHVTPHVAPVPIPKMVPVRRIRKLDFPDEPETHKIPRSKADEHVLKMKPVKPLKPVKHIRKLDMNEDDFDFQIDEPFKPVPILKHPEREESRVVRYRGPSKRRQDYELLEESKPVIDPRFQLMHEQQRDRGLRPELHTERANLQQLMLSQYATDRREQRHHLADSERRKYKDRNDERQFELAKMKIEHIEPLTRANIQSRQQSIIEQDATVARRLHVQSHNHELVQLHQAYCETQKEDRLNIIYREFGIDTYNPDDVYISPPTVESYMIMKRNYTYSHLCIGVKNVVPGNNFIIVELIDGSKHRFNLDDQFYRIENFGSGVVVIRFMRHIGFKEKRMLRCPCPNCEIA